MSGLCFFIPHNKKEEIESELDLLEIEDLDTYYTVYMNSPCIFVQCTGRDLTQEEKDLIIPTVGGEGGTLITERRFMFAS